MKRRIIGFIASLAIALGIGITTATPASAAWYPAGGPTVYMNQRCPGSFWTGVANIYKYYLRADTGSYCKYERYDGYGTTWTYKYIYKQYRTY
jgi:hypothetical protein